MSAIILSAANLLTLKRHLRPLYPDVGSSHLTEAIAAALGRRTHAALLADVNGMDPADPDIETLDDNAFSNRLAALGYEVPDEDRKMGVFDWMGDLERKGVLIHTTPASAFEIEYTSLRHKAWRNALIAALNAGIERRLFSIRPDDNRWPGWEPDREKRFRQPDRTGATYRFTFGDGAPALAYVSDAGFDELRVNAVLWPTEHAEEWIDVANAGFRAGDVVASGWLERRDGAWLQYSPKGFRCRQHRLKSVAAVSIRPKGYGDRGGLKM